jgi:hypothetical protein
VFDNGAKQTRPIRVESWRLQFEHGAIQRFAAVAGAEPEDLHADSVAAHRRAEPAQALGDEVHERRVPLAAWGYFFFDAGCRNEGGATPGFAFTCLGLRISRLLFF